MLVSNVGYATLSIIPSAKGFAKALSGETKAPLQSEGTEAGKTFGDSFGKAFKVVGAAAIAGAAVGFGVAAKGVFAAIDFDQQMREVFTLMPGITGEAMNEMTDQVKDFSKEFGVLPDQVVPALYQSISAGVPTDNVFEFLETAQLAAKGGVTDLTTAVDGISSVVNAYGDDVLDATQASDLMFTAVRLGKTNFEELSASLFQVTPTASALGVQFGDVTAGLAALTAQGVPTSVATTQMRQLFVELSKEGGKAANTFEEMAGKTFKDFIAEGGNTADALDLMVLAAADANVGVNDLFGSVQAGSAALALAGSETFVDNIDAMGDSSGATSAAFDTMNQGLRPLIDRFKAWGAVMLIEIGERVIPIIEKVIEVVQRHWPTISAVIGTVMATVQSVIGSVVSWVQANWPTIQSVISTTVDVIVTVLGTLRDGFMAAFGWLMDNREVLIGVAVAVGAGLVAMFTAWAVSAGAAAIATLAAAAPFIALGAAIAAVVALVIKAYNEWDWFRDAVDAVAAFITGPLVDAFKDVWDWVQNLWDRTEGLRSFLLGAFRTAIDLVVGYYTTLWRIIETVWGWIQTLWDRSEGIRGFLVGAFVRGLDIARAGFVRVRDIIMAVWNWVQNVWDRTEEFRAFLVGAMQTGLNIARDAFARVRDIIMAVWSWVKSVWDRTDGLRGFLVGVFSTAVGIAADAIDGITTALKTVWEWAGKAWNALDKIKNFVGMPHAGNMNVDVDAYLRDRGFDIPGNAPGNAQGTNYWRGGLSWVGERGPELINMPRGTQVFDARASRRIADGASTAAGPRVGMQVESQHFHSGLDVSTVMRVANMAMEAA